MSYKLTFRWIGPRITIVFFFLEGTGGERQPHKVGILLIICHFFLHFPKKINTDLHDKLY